MTRTQNRWYVFNRWTGEYTYSVRVLLTGWNDGEFHLIARTAVRGPKYGRYPDTNFWQDQSVVATNDWTGWYGNGNELSDMSGTYKGTPDYLCINRAIFRKYGSDVATVGFSGDVSLGGQTDIALGVKLAVLPKANSTFAAPVFSGEGDVEYQCDAVLANANLMKYASELSVTGNFVRVGNNANLTPLLNVAGPIASTIGCNLDMAGVGTDPKFIFNVADIPDVAEDCVMNKDIKVRNGNFGSYGFSFVKSGAGTLKMCGTIYAPTKIEGGALVFGATGGMSTANNDIELSGATLGKESGALSAGTLSVGAGGGTLEFGPNATMSFADSSAKTWAGPLVIRGFRDNAIRFGTSKDALTSAQQDLIRTSEGRKLHIASNGYLAIPGCRIIVR